MRASEKQKHEYLPKLCSGIYSAGSFCLSEVSAGSDPAGIKTRAVKDGDQWILNGTKMWVSSAEYAGIFIVWAVTDSKAPKGKGISCFLVEADLFAAGPFLLLSLPSAGAAFFAGGTIFIVLILAFLLVEAARGRPPESSSRPFLLACVLGMDSLF